jgi:putative ABC transport system permease protein
MVVQLLLIGYFLIYIFESNSPWIVILSMAVMVFASSWISLNTIKAKRKVFYKRALFSITVGGGTTLLLITQGVLNLHPWYWPRYMIPLAGMIFANAMNSVSLAAERLEAECEEVIRFNKTLNMKRVKGNKNQNFPDSSFWQKNSTCFCKGPFSFNSRSMAPME